jgi:Domain of unknown function (DUF362)
MKKTITRRDFLRAATAVPLAGTLVPALKAGEPAASPWPAVCAGPAKTRVVLVRDQACLDASGAPNAEVVQRMLDEAVSRLLDAPDPVAGWKTLIKPDDIVGIKTNVWNYIPTTSAVEQALKRRVMDAGVPESKIGIDDRGVRRNPIFQQATALINARPARAHTWAGMGSLIKNYIMFTPQASDWHGDTCADLAKIWEMPEVKGKTRLNVLVMFTPLFHCSGPQSFSRDYIWPYGGLIVSRDPVAADATGLRILQAKRRQHFGDDRPFDYDPHHIFLAETRHGLGVASEDRIELLKLGWQEGTLI